MSNRLFKAKFNADPYSMVDYEGYKFIHLNNFLGSTQDHTSTDFNPGVGSLGEEQLHWSRRRSSSITRRFRLHPLSARTESSNEFADYGLYPLLLKYQETVQLVVSGHRHVWIDAAIPMGRSISSWRPRVTIPMPTC